MPDIATDPIMVVVGSAVVPVAEPTLFTAPGRFWLTAVPADVSRSPDQPVGVSCAVHVGTVEELTANFRASLTRAFEYMARGSDPALFARQTAVLHAQYPAAAGQAVPYVCGVGHYRDLCCLRGAPSSGLGAEHRDLLARVVGQYVGERANARGDDEAADVANRLSPDVPGMVRPTTDPGAARLLRDALNQLLGEAEPAAVGVAHESDPVAPGVRRAWSVSVKQPPTGASEGWTAARDDDRQPYSGKEAHMTAKKKALCVGINYLGTDYALRGCLNDADDWAAVFRGVGFDAGVLAEKAATKAQILMNLRSLVDGLKAGDVGAFTYSGHGTWVPDRNGDEPDGRDEAICPVDMGADGHNLIVDDDLRAVFMRLAPGARLIVAFDSCHSGTAFRNAPPVPGVSYRRPRFLPPSHFVTDPTKLAQVSRVFGQPAARSDGPLPGVAFFSACKDTETAADAEIGGRPCGAFSHFAVAAVKAAGQAGKTYAQAFTAIRKSLPSWDFSQTPQFAADAVTRGAKVFG